MFGCLAIFDFYIFVDMECNFCFGFGLLFNQAAFLTLLVCGVRVHVFFSFLFVLSLDMECNFRFDFGLLFNHAAFLTLLICGVRARMCLVSF